MERPGLVPGFPPDQKSEGIPMNGIIYAVGLVVVVVAILSLVGLL